MTDASYLAAVKPCPRAAGGARSRSHRPPRTPPACCKSSEPTAATASARPYRATS